MISEIVAPQQLSVGKFCAATKIQQQSEGLGVLANHPCSFSYTLEAWEQAVGTVGLCSLSMGKCPKHQPLRRGQEALSTSLLH